MGHPDNRLTQLDMLAVEAAKSSNKVTERAVLYDSLGSTPKSGVSSKKGAGSLVGALDTTTEKGRVQSKAVRSATSGPLQLRSAWESAWGKYEKIGFRGGRPRGASAMAPGRRLPKNAKYVDLRTKNDVIPFPLASVAS